MTSLDAKIYCEFSGGILFQQGGFFGRNHFFRANSHAIEMVFIVTGHAGASKVSCNHGK